MIVKKVLSAVVSATLMLTAISCEDKTSIPPEGIFHVSPKGNDRWTGTRAKPWKTLAHALEEAAKNNDARQVTIVLKEGVYPISETINLEGNKNIKIVAEGEGTPVIAGDRVLKGWKPVKDKRILGRLPEGSRGKVWQASLKKSGTDDSGQVAGDTNRVDIYYRGLRQQPSRWPDKGFSYDIKARGANPIAADYFKHAGTKEGILEYGDDRLDEWADEKEAYMHGYWSALWYEDYAKVEEVDPERNIIRLAQPYREGGYRDSLRFSVVNLLCETDAPGEYYLDSSNETVYYYAPEGFSPNGGDVTCSVFGPKYMITIKDCENITISGITFRGGRNSGISVCGSRNLEFRDCQFTQFGDDAIYIDDCKFVRIEGCLFNQLGRGGIEAHGGDRKTLETSGYIVDNTVFSDFSLYKSTYEPAIVFYGCGMEITRNQFQNCPSSALRLEGNDILVEKNRFVNLVTESDDQGALDTYYNFTFRGNVIRYNWWQDIQGDLEYGHFGPSAIRLDDMISGFRIYGNVFVNCGLGNRHWRGRWGALQINGGKDNTFENNLIYGCVSSMHISTTPQQNFDACFLRPEVQKKLKEVDFPSSLYRQRYPELATEEGLSLHANRNYVLRNLSVSPRYKSNGLENSVVKGNTELASNKPIEYFLDPKVLEGYGLDPIPFEDMGVKDNRFKDTIELL